MIIERRLTGNEKDFCKDCVVDQLKHYIFPRKMQLTAALAAYMVEHSERLRVPRALRSFEKIKQANWLHVDGAQAANIIDLIADVLGSSFVDAANIALSLINNAVTDEFLEDMGEDYSQVRIVYKAAQAKK